MKPLVPPEFMPGDMLRVVGVEFPPMSGRIKEWVGVFQDVGFPLPVTHLTQRLQKTTDRFKTVQLKKQISEVLSDKCVGTLQNGEHVLVIAVRFCERDKRWYYLMRGTANRKCFGWTRSAIRFEKVGV